MIVLGLTGSIGMGKSTVARMFAEAGVAVCDSDAVVHALYAPGGAAVGPVGAAFPGVVRGGAVDRAALSEALRTDPDSLKELEAIVHPLVGQAQQAFLDRARAAGTGVVVLDIPLLFESGNARGKVDKIVVVSAPAAIQRARALARGDLSEAKFDWLLARQVPDAVKRAGADFVIENGGSLEETRAQVRALLDALAKAG